MDVFNSSNYMRNYLNKQLFIKIYSVTMPACSTKAKKYRMSICIKAIE